MDVVFQAQDAFQKLVAEVLILRQDNRDLQERLEAAMALLSPPAIQEFAQPLDVTHIETDTDVA